jgi:hypothetical protein
MQIVNIDIDKLIPYARNSRTHSDAQVAQIAASIKEFGWTNPVLVDGENGIIAGHGRVLAARMLGMDTVPVIELSHLTKAQKQAYIIADNKLALNAGWDDQLLILELTELKELDFDINLIGFDTQELDTLVQFQINTVDMPELRIGDKEPFQQMTFTLHDDQVEQIKLACDIAKNMGEFDSPNENSNGNALSRVCETFITNHGKS